jgi:DNA-binding CsgD family transcriptional regulator
MRVFHSEIADTIEVRPAQGRSIRSELAANPPRDEQGQGEVPLHKSKRNTHAACGAGEVSAVEAGAFAFCDRASGAIRFQVRAGADGELPLEEAASMLAMHCLVRTQRPEEYVVLVVPRRDPLEPVRGRAEHLLTAGRKAVGSGVRLSVRQRQVLEHVLQDLSNKEIGARLNVSERTVKFHVSHLLAKFKAHDRAGLKHEAAIGMLPTSSVPGDTLFGFMVPAELAAQTGDPPAKHAGSGNAGRPKTASLLDFRAARREEMHGAVRQ